jgi:hypothetical protein
LEVCWNISASLSTKYHCERYPFTLLIIFFAQTFLISVHTIERRLHRRAVRGEEVILPKWGISRPDNATANFTLISFFLVCEQFVSASYPEHIFKPLWTGVLHCYLAILHGYIYWPASSYIELLTIY